MCAPIAAAIGACEPSANVTLAYTRVDAYGAALARLLPREHGARAPGNLRRIQDKSSPGGRLCSASSAASSEARYRAAFSPTECRAQRWFATAPLRQSVTLSQRGGGAPDAAASTEMCLIIACSSLGLVRVLIEILEEQLHLPAVQR